MIFKFVAPFLHDADGRQRRGIAERAESAPEHIFRKLVNQRNIFRAAAALVEAVEHFAQPGGAFAAGNAPAAGFVRVKMHDAARQIHHAGIFVNDHRAAGAEHRADLGDRIVIHADVNFVGAQAAGTNCRRESPPSVSCRPRMPPATSSISWRRVNPSGSS